MWQRRPGAPAAIAHLGLSVGDRRDLPSTGARAGGGTPVQCSSVRGLARIAQADGAQLVAASPPAIVSVDIAGGEHPTWTYTHPGLEMNGAGRLGTTFELPRGGVWELWLRGEIMPTVDVSVDGRALGSIGGQLAGNPHNPDTLTPLRVTLNAGLHRLTIARGAWNLAPGDGGWAILHEAFLTPADAPDVDTLTVTPPARWPALCGGQFDWIEVTRVVSR